MEKNLAKTYDPKDFEDRIYEMWETNGAFHAEVDPDKKAVHHRDAASKHYGTASHGTRAGPDFAGCSDAFQASAGATVRCGLPGSDHASIATEVR